MTPFLSRLWQRLLNDLGLREPRRRVYSLDEGLLPSLQDLAAREQRPEEEVLSDLVSQALQQRQKTAERSTRWSQLSRREQQVVALTCLGYTNPEIARRLFLSPETIRTYSRSAMRKFGVRTKAQLRQVLEEWDFSAWEPPSTRRQI
jgi:DNA-binding CsgD family transcriptional regulator